MLHPTINKIWKRIVLSYWPSFMKNDKTISNYSKHINQRWDLFFQIRFVTVKKYLHKHPFVKPNCRKKHGLRKFTCDTAGYFECDECASSIPADKVLYGCRLCDYDLCQKCYKKKSEGLIPFLF